jgi:hypothetical protein
MSASDKSKGTLYRTYCDSCKEKINIGVATQLPSIPEHCPFCKGTLDTDSVETRERD